MLRECSLVLVGMAVITWNFTHSGSTGVCEMATVDNDGRRRRYKPGPKNGINDMGRSQEPLSNLQIGLALKYMLHCLLLPPFHNNCSLRFSHTFFLIKIGECKNTSLC